MPFTAALDARAPIGVFDSGVGGLTVLAAMRQTMPGEDYLYLGDTARLPYGSKSRETIIRYCRQTTFRLVEQGIKLLVIACNTATAAALPALRESYPELPIIGVVEPGSRAACAASARGNIAVIATESTVNGGAYRDAILRLRPEASVVSLPCPLFVPLAEEGWFEGDIVEQIAARYLQPLFSGPQQPDCLVLGCTHYPMLKKAIGNVVGPAVRLVDSAATTAEAVRDELKGSGMEHPGQHREGRVLFFTTDDAARFARTGSLFLGRAIAAEDVQLVDL